jgi:hypothetical protein
LVRVDPTGRPRPAQSDHGRSRPAHPYLPIGQDPLRAEPSGSVVFGLDPQGSEDSPHHQRHDDDHDCCDEHVSLSFLWDDWRRVAGLLPPGTSVPHSVARRSGAGLAHPLPSTPGRDAPGLHPPVRSRGRRILGQGTLIGPSHHPTIRIRDRPLPQGLGRACLAAHHVRVVLAPWPSTRLSGDTLKRSTREASMPRERLRPPLPPRRYLKQWEQSGASPQ